MFKPPPRCGPRFPPPPATRPSGRHWDEVCGFGPIQGLLDDPSVTEVMVNRWDKVFAERAGRSSLTSVKFDDDAHVRRVIEKIIVPLGRHIEPKNPLVDARLPDGSRVNACIPPVAIDGCNVTIRKFPTRRLGIDDLVKYGSISQHMADLLQACVASRINIVVSGGTGSGKTTLLNVLSTFIPGHERVVTDRRRGRAATGAGAGRPTRKQKARA